LKAEPQPHIYLFVRNALYYCRQVMEGFLDYSVQHSPWKIVQHSENIHNYWEFSQDIPRPGIFGHFYEPRDFEVLAEFQRQGVPIVNFSNKVNDYGIPAVLPDNEHAGRVAAEYFLGRKFNHFAFSGIRDARYSDLRGKGFKDRLAEAGYDCDTFEYGHHNWVNSSVKSAPDLEAWLDALPKPLAMLAGDDIHARRTLYAIERMGLRVPEEVAVLGVDNDHVQCRLSPTPISSVTIPAYRVGYEAARQLHDLFEGKPAPDSPIRIRGSEVVTRRSTDCVAVGDYVLASAMRFIAENAHTPIKVSDVVASCGASRRYLERRFAAVLGKTPRREIFEVRIAKAKCLLSDSRITVQEVADGCGFSDAKLFATSFRKETGMTPSEFRNRERQRHTG